MGNYNLFGIPRLCFSEAGESGGIAGELKALVTPAFRPFLVRAGSPTISGEAGEAII